jgi:N-acetylmuramic acid 6-phosphate etherase
MQIRRTEAIHEAAEGLDARPAAEIAAILLDGQLAALQAVRGALPALADGAAAMARAVASGSAIHYAAAGSSGLMAAADAMELAGTFGIDPARVFIHMAGGLPQDATMPGGTEDDAGAGAEAAAGVAPGDAAIVVAASGSTPYALGFAKAAAALDAAGAGRDPDDRELAQRRPADLAGAAHPAFEAAIRASRSSSRPGPGRIQRA